MNTNKVYLVLGAVLGLVLVGFLFYPFNKSSETAAPVGQEITPTTVTPPPAPAYVPPTSGLVQPVLPLSSQADIVVDMTTIGFSPADLIIQKGQSVIWTNRDRASHQIATAAADTYPSNGPTAAVSSCGVIKLGDSCKVTFSSIGIWKFYDKLNSKFTGSVTVK